MTTPQGDGGGQEFPLYPNYPAAPPVAGVTAGQAVRPRVVDVAVWCSFAAAAVSFLANVIGALTHSGGFTGVTFYSTRSFTDADGVTHSVTRTGGASAVAGVVIGLIVAGLWVGLIFALRAGANWARVLLTVLGGLGCLAVIVGLATAAGLTVPGSLDIVVLGLVVVALAQLYRGPANWYFKHR
jgi:hypothetical protein